MVKFLEDRGGVIKYNTRLVDIPINTIKTLIKALQPKTEIIISFSKIIKSFSQIYINFTQRKIQIERPRMKLLPCKVKSEKTFFLRIKRKGAQKSHEKYNFLIMKRQMVHLLGKY